MKEGIATAQTGWDCYDGSDLTQGRAYWPACDQTSRNQTAKLLVGWEWAGSPAIRTSNAPKPASVAN